MAAQLSSKSSPVAMSQKCSKSAESKSGGPQVHAHGVTCVEPFDFGHVGGYLSIQIGDKVDVLHYEEPWVYVRRRFGLEGWVPKICIDLEKAAGARGHISFFTFGLENFDDVVLEECSKHKRGAAGAQISVKMLKDALSRHNVKDVDIVLDCRRFHDPNYDRSLRGHIGVHPGEICFHPRLPGFLRFAKQMLFKAETARQCAQTSEPNRLPILKLACFCKVGKHRCIAVAEVLRHVLSETGYIIQDDVAHLSKPHWYLDCCTGECSECKDQTSALRKAALANASEIWGKL